MLDPAVKKSLAGSHISTGLVRYHDLCYLVTTDDEDVAEGVSRSRFYSVDAGKWGGRQLDWMICSAAAVTVPAERALFLGRWGEVYAIGGGESDLEGRIEAKKRRGHMREIRSIAGRAYAVGLCRQAYRRDAPGKWTRIDASAQTKDMDPGDSGFNSIDGVDEKEIYAVGWNGEIWRYDGKRWKRQKSPTNYALHKVRVGKDAVYACGQMGTLLRGDGKSWKAIPHGLDEEFWGLAWFDGSLYVSTLESVFRLQKDKLVPAKFGKTAPRTCYHLSAADGLLWSIGARDVMGFDGSKWKQVLKL